ncbi:MAG: glycine cleavage system protein GcvH [Alphaproteobacteria bacterium]|nr:glycine cleavage system protein GcvH [Alphaproteobacteria bacterium]
MADFIYIKSHEWARIDGGVATMGISDYAQGQLGDVVYVELPKVGQKVEAGGQIAVVESVKAASEVYAPLGGEVVEVNAKLADDPALINRAATGDGWFLKLKLANPGATSGLMDEGAYAKFVESLK